MSAEETRVVVLRAQLDQAEMEAEYHRAALLTALEDLWEAA